MPIYEYLCKSCQKKVTIFQRFVSTDTQPSCPVCGGTGLSRLFSCFAIHKSISTIHEESGEPGISESREYYKDPRNIGRHLEKRFKNLNIEMPSEIQQSIEAAREGVLPDSLKDIESASPDSSYH